MNLALVPRMTIDEFLAWEGQQEERFEFDGFQAIPMNGGTIEHSIIAFNLCSALQARLVGSGCRAVIQTVKVEVVGRVRYPDVAVTCAPIGRGKTVLPEPVLVAEIVSPSSDDLDRRIKMLEYRATASIQHYLILDQNGVMATLFSREGGEWLGRIVGPGETIRLPALGIEFPIADAYEGIASPDQPA